MTTQDEPQGQDRIANWLGGARKEVIDETRAALQELKDLSDNRIDAAIERLLEKTGEMVQMWETASNRISRMGIGAMADIALSGGIVWAYEWQVPDTIFSSFIGQPISLAEILRESVDSFRFDGRGWPHSKLEKGKRYEFFILMQPKSGK